MPGLALEAGVYKHADSAGKRPNAKWIIPYQVPFSEAFRRLNHLNRVLALPEGTRLYLLAPVVRGRKGEYKKELAEYLKKGFQRVKIDGTFHELSNAPTLDKKFPHDIDVVVDRIVVRADIGQRLAESFETALKLAEGLAVIEYADAPAAAPAEDAKKKTAKIHDKSGPERILFSEKFACPVSGFTIPEIEPRLFSFNNPYGACPACGGLGVEQHIDQDLVIPDKELSLRKGAIAPWAKSSSPYYLQTLTALGKHYKFTLDTPWKDLPKKVQNVLLTGSGEEAIKFSYEDGVRSYDTKKPFEGVITNLERRYRETESEWAREELGVTINEIFGQTEANYLIGGCARVFDPKPGALGRPYPGHRIALLDEAGRELPHGELGEIAVCTDADPVIFLGYWNNPEATAAKCSGAWLRTGDLAERDADGYYWYRGRTDDVIKSAGYRVGPSEIENCLLHHPAVANVAVIGVPDETRGHIIKAVIVATAGTTPDASLERELQQFVRERLAPYQCPRLFEFVAALPMTTTGKVQRRVLRDA